MFNLETKKGLLFYVTRDIKGKKTSSKYLGKVVTLSKSFENIETDEVIWTLSFDYLGKKKEIELERKNICDNKALVSLLASKGADVTARNADYFVDSLREQEYNFSNSEKVFNNVGWIFLFVNGVLTPHYRCTELIGTYNAKYKGKYMLVPQGTLEGWKELVKNEVLGRVQLETVLLASLSAPIVGLISSVTTGENPIVHINFDSGKGKSTVLYLAASAAGMPFDGKKTMYDRDEPYEAISVYQNWGATEKAMVTSCTGNRGMPVILNELGKYTGKDLSSVVFHLSEGSDMRRLKTNLESRVTEGYDTTFVSCGEMSLLKKCKTELNGIKIRVMEIEEAMTEDASHARRIKEGARKHNGFAIPMIAKHIVDNGGIEMVTELYRSTLSDLIANAPDGVNERFVEKFPAFFVTTAKLAKLALNLEFDEQGVADFCYRCWQHTKGNEDIGVKSYNDVIAECRTYPDNFYIRGNGAPKVVWGAIKYYNNADTSNNSNNCVVMEYGIRRSILENILQNKGYPNINTCISAWKKAGYLNYEQGKNTRTRKIGDAPGLEEDLFVLKVFGSPTSIIKKPTRSKMVEKLLGKDAEDDEGDAVIDNNNIVENLVVANVSNTNNGQEVTADERNNVDNKTLDS
jgi:hypothetical protein